MKQPTPQWPDSWSESARFSPRPSALLRSWWWFLHGLAAAAVLASSLEPWWKCLVLAGALAHSRWRRASRAPDFERVAPGIWSVPGLDRHGLAISARSRCGGWWIRLILEDARGALDWVLYFDQLPPPDWRLLEAEVRGAVCGRSATRVRMR